MACRRGFRHGPICLLFGGLLALAACTSAHWERAGSDDTRTRADETECHNAAADESSRFDEDRYGDRDGFSLRGPSMRRFFAEQDFTERCMRSKGYRLVTAPKA